ncbi:MAG: alpha/beta fold hydrolase [Fibrobacter sp.]|jgi:alpha/beta superfamily hydrolase|nr:alpha/beta fold hydrolase [Fibrobacter sp.]
MHKFSYFELPGDKNQLIRGSLHISGSGIQAPWFIFCHGFTGQRMGPGYLFVKISRALADEGFCSVRFDFRGSGESDGKFPEMNVSTMKNDLMAVISWLKKNHNPSRIFLLGHSFGGMIAALCSKEANGVTLLSPVGNPQKLISSQKKIIESGPNSEGYYEHGPHEMDSSFASFLLEINPVETLCKNLKGALLLIQGDSDKSITVEESSVYVTEARKCGIDCEYHVFNGADHNFSRVSDVKLLCRTVNRWAKEHTS